MIQQHKQQAETAWQALTDKGDILDRVSFEIGYGQALKALIDVSENVKERAMSKGAEYADWYKAALLESDEINERDLDPIDWYGNRTDFARGYLAGASESAAALALAKSQCEELMKENMRLEGMLEKPDSEMVAFAEWVDQTYTQPCKDGNTITGNWLELHGGDVPFRSTYDLLDVFRQQTARS